jgi:hypothetical protein
MSFFNGPTIVKNELVILWDAANIKSYPKNGNTILNICNNQFKNITLYNSFYTGTYNGGIYCTGAASDFRMANGSTPFLSGQFHISSWVSFTATGSDQVIFSPDSNGADNWIMLKSNNCFNLFLTSSADVNNRNYDSINQIQKVNLPYYVSLNIYTGGMDVYINGILDRRIADTGVVGAWTNTYYWGSRGGFQRFLSGTIFCSQMYARALSDAEVQQNFNATRGRFSL